MPEREQDDQQDETQNGESADDFVDEIEDDPSTAGDPDEPGDELRGG